MGAFTWAIVNDRPLCAVAAAMSELGSFADVTVRPSLVRLPSKPDIGRRRDHVG